jgi:DtxR family transcriptional regulator, Mn-dependent transcriptional regulator
MSRDIPETGVTASQEDYLEAIFLLSEEKRVARSKEIAERLRVTKASVTGALRQLKASGLVNHDPYSYITLTPEGERIARDVTRRHEILADFLYRVLGLDTKTADENACRIEHAIDKDVLEKLVDFVAYLDSEDPDVGEWMAQVKEAQQG